MAVAPLSFVLSVLLPNNISFRHLLFFSSDVKLACVRERVSEGEEGKEGVTRLGMDGWSIRPFLLV